MKPTHPAQPLRERACTSKVRYDSAPEAELMALTRMLENADKPLSVYECTFCTGYHLTSSDRVSSQTVPIEKPVTKVHVLSALRFQMARDGFTARRSKLQRRERIRAAQRRRQHREVAEFFAKNPPPRVATPEEVDRFFLRHGGVA